MWRLNILLFISFGQYCFCENNESITLSSIELSQSNFDSELKAKNVLIVFYSPGYVLHIIN